MNEASSSAPQANVRDGVSLQSSTTDPAGSSGASTSEIGKDKTSQPKWPRLVAAATLVLLPLVNFYPAVFGRIMLAPGDGWTQIFGIRVLIGQMISSGQLPLWNPYIFVGMPLAASIQPSALYPSTWLFAVLSPKAVMNAMVISTWLHKV
jgi:hypothetical protein